MQKALQDLGVQRMSPQAAGRGQSLDQFCVEHLRKQRQRGRSPISKKVIRTRVSKLPDLDGRLFSTRGVFPVNESTARAVHRGGKIQGARTSRTTTRQRPYAA